MKTDNVQSILDRVLAEKAEKKAEQAREKARKPLVATPFKYRDPASIAPRAWIYNWHYIRKFTSATIAPGGLGKSSLSLVEAIAISLGLPLLGVAPREQVNVWYWNGEDPAEETERRIAAICQRYDIDGRKLEGRLFIDTGRLAPIKIAAMKRGEAVFDRELEADIKQTIRENEIGVATLDPFISVHDVPESDNTNINAVAKCFGHIADETNASIEFVHHVRKASSGKQRSPPTMPAGLAPCMMPSALCGCSTA
jgi:RecA-family ATPase